MCGTRLVIHEKQIPSIRELNAFFARKKDADYIPIQVEPNDLVVGSSNRQALAAIGVLGELVETPGHSDDSISLVLDDGSAFTGDLTRPDMAGEENAAALTASWEKILRLHAQRIYAGHGGPMAAGEIETMLRSGG